VKLLCPRCGYPTTVKYTWGGDRSAHIKLPMLHMLDNTLVRRRKCLNDDCAFIFRTVEVPLAPPPPPTAEARKEDRNFIQRQRRRRRKEEKDANNSNNH